MLQLHCLIYKVYFAQMEEIFRSSFNYTKEYYKSSFDSCLNSCGLVIGNEKHRIVFSVVEADFNCSKFMFAEVQNMCIVEDRSKK